MSFKTSLYDKHLALKAKMAPFAGFEMPIQYTSVKEEVLAVRNAVGIFDVSHMGEFFVEGKDAVLFVDSLIPNDFKNAELKKAVYSPLCREDGTMIDDLIAYKLSEERVMICVNASNIEKDWNWISGQKREFACTLTNQSNDFSLVAIQGPGAEQSLLKLGLLNESELNFPYYSILEKTIDQQKLIIARTGYTGEDGFEIFASHQSILKIWDQSMEIGITPCGLAARDVLRLEVCYPLYGHELNDQVNPYDSGLAWTVKLQKPQFIGKSALEKVFQEKSKLQLVKLALAKGIPREGYAVTNERHETIGTVTSGTMSVVLNKGIALALIEKNKMPNDKKFFITIRNQQYPAEYLTKPFVTGGHK